MRAVLVLMWVLHWLPLPVLGRLGEGVGSLLFMVIRKRRHITLTNLSLCLPQLSEAERLAMAKRHFQVYARSVLERGILWWASEARLKRLIQIDPAVPMAAMADGPTILMCPHFVSLDVAGVAVMLESSLCSIYTQQRSKVFDAALRKGRSRFRPVKLFSRAEGVKPIIRAMREGLPFFMLPDMDFGAKDAEFVSFFGVPAATLTAVPRIAATTGAKVIPVIATILPNYQGWKVTFHEPWKNYPGDDIVAATRSMNAFIEQEILKAPAEYFWAHKRFKTRPPGEPSVY
ncbi:LpxL/LpxP family acyltransferase [Undibacterium umbellatum]|jgi:KDO2-lipid IV(A) lauroyltransferase|uniref:Lipid A biosynthesis acyltransferase n=1 Tax=Undibacterium umbellatum TaxID=2762300 RepID=A0ABR6Z786_9BURK|nr:lipid A biosynthesis acyltransferase [Undibacterium umbellatum]MBC3907641.1 lipid A biosynthesis acyltransferase [Undibacterium umbellatum]